VNKVSRTFNCLITETPQDMTSEGKGWLVTVDGEAFDSQFSMKISYAPGAVASKLAKGQRYALILQRQNIKTNKQEGAPYDGEKDWHYFWKIERFAETGDTIPQVPVSVANESPATTPLSASWSGSIDERIAWNSAINNAVTAIPWISNMTEDKEAYFTPNWRNEVDLLAQDIYALIRRGPTPVEEDVYDESAQQISEDDITGGLPF
jgi:hypothetical protein